MRGIIHELLWFLSGSGNIKYLVDNDVHIWDAWPYRYYKETTKDSLSQEEFISKIKTDNEFAKKWGNLGPVYGVQWRHWPKKEGEVDQIARVISQIKDVAQGKDYSASRRLLVSAWNASEIEEMAKAGLPPCHTMFQFYVSADGKLSCQLYQRSADMFLGVPFNIASYALLTLMVAQVTNLKPGDFVHTFGDTHIYSNHLDQVKEQLTRTPKAFPIMKLNPKIKDIFGFTYEDFTLENYDPHPPIKAAVAV